MLKRKIKFVNNFQCNRKHIVSCTSNHTTTISLFVTAQHTTVCTHFSQSRHARTHNVIHHHSIVFQHAHTKCGATKICSTNKIRTTFHHYILLQTKSIFNISLFQQHFLSLDAHWIFHSNLYFYAL